MKNKYDSIKSKTWTVSENFMEEKIREKQDSTWDGILLEEETAIKLGGPKHPSTANILFTTQLADISPGKITLFGSDLLMIDKKESSFGLLCVILTDSISPKKMNIIRRTLILTNEIEGLSMEPNPKSPRFKVSKFLIEKESSFKDIGEKLMRLLISRFPKQIHGIEIYFASDCNEIVIGIQEIQNLIKQKTVHMIRKNISQEIYKKVRTDCDLEIECIVCENIKICTEINKIFQMRNQRKKDNRN